jgi:dTDP-4-amino-4,6-dideoxy-D-galactose acyltransferase
MMTGSDVCQFLDWDSDFFGRRIARVTTNSLTVDSVQSILVWCRARQIDCLYFLCNADDGNTVRLAEDNGFRFVDIRMTLERQVDGVRPVQGAACEAIIRACAAGDIPALRSIAGATHRDSRFYNDPNFPGELCDALYATWIEKSCRGYADTVLVVELDGQPVGYVSCHLHTGSRGQIGLIGVGGGSQGKGLGGILVNASLDWCASRQMTRVTVVTQGRNVKALRLYQKCGFLVQSVQLWYHKWFLA